MVNNENLTLVFVRHGHKVESGDGRLTSIGYRQVSSTAVRLRDELNLWPDEILHSPALESLQSADLVNRAYESSWKGWLRNFFNTIQVKQSDALRSGARDEFTRVALRDLNPEHKTVLCVADLDVIRSQFAFLHEEFSFFNVEKKLGPGFALVAHFEEANWGDIDRSTMPVEYRIIGPMLG